MTNKQFIQQYLTKPSKNAISDSGSLKILDGYLYSYGTKIAYVEPSDRVIYLCDVKYSPTTSKHQSLVRKESLGLFVIKPFKLLL